MTEEQRQSDRDTPVGADSTVEEFFDDTPPLEGYSVPSDEQEMISRRKFLTGTLAGGAAGLAVAAGTGVAVWKVAEGEAVEAKAAADAALQASQAEAAAELARLQGLVDLYEQLEKIGLDGILEAGMVALALPLAAIEAGVKALKDGLEWSEKALLSLSEALPTAQESLSWLEARVTAVATGIEKLETSLGRALDRVTDNAVAEALEEFINKVLDSLPFGLGDKFRDALEGLVTLMTSVDELVAGINTHLLEPLREKWFSDEEGKGVGGTFVTPLIEHVLDPLEAHLANVAELADTWQMKLKDPAQQALAERASVREEIARYRQEHGFS
jgi:chromosome segregation ATPase